MTYKIQVIDSSGTVLHEVDVVSHNFVEMDFMPRNGPVVDSNGDEMLHKWCFQATAFNKEGVQLV